MRDPVRFLRDMAGFSEAQRRRTSADKRVRLATIDPDHRPEDIFGGVFPKVRFDGESTLSRKRYPLVKGIIPNPGDRVVLTPVGTTYLITDIIYDPNNDPIPDERLIIKRSDQSVTSSTTLVDDNDIYALVEPNRVYRVILVLNATGSTGGDIRLSWSVPSGSDAGGRWLQGPHESTDPAGAATMEVRAALWSTERVYGTSGSANSIIEHGLLQTGDSPGFLRLRWAQGTSNGTATTVMERTNLWVNHLWDNELSGS